jgi:hypothetical protein
MDRKHHHVRKLLYSLFQLQFNALFILTESLVHYLLKLYLLRFYNHSSPSFISTGEHQMILSKASHTEHHAGICRFSKSSSGSRILLLSSKLQGMKREFTIRQIYDRIYWSWRVMLINAGRYLGRYIVCQELVGIVCHWS